MVQIIPAILATTEKDYGYNISKIKSSKLYKSNWVHIDFTDNKFVQNQTVDINIIKQYPTDFKIEAHLMVQTPSTLVGDLKDMGVKRVIAHVEVGEEEIDGFIAECKVNDLEVGLAIKMDSSLEGLEPYWEAIDMVLIMSVEPGFQGQPFITKALNRIKEVAKLCQTYENSFIISVDGHIDDHTAKKVVEAGADQLVVGSYLLKGKFDENLEKIKNSI